MGDGERKQRGLISIKPSRLVWHRENRGLSQRQLAAKSGVGATSIALIERGERQPGPEVARSLALALELPLEVLADWTPKGLKWLLSSSSAGALAAPAAAPPPTPGSDAANPLTGEDE